jgi:nucleoside-diphosphate-sugar epimerase
VLGGTGFIGVALSRYLADQGHDVVVVARRPPAGGAPGRVRTLDLAGTPAPQVADLLREERVDAVVNAAGGMWGLTDEQMVAANITLVHALIEAVAQLPGRPRLVQLGSVHEYGLVPIGASMAEDTPPRPVMKPYAELKLRCTEAVAEAARTGRIDGLTLRIGNVVGAGQPRVSLLGVVAAKLAEAGRTGGAGKLELSPLASQRDFVGLSDAVRAVGAALALPAVPPPVINIGRGVAVTAREMVQTLIEVSGVPTELIEAPPTGEPEQAWQRLDIRLAARVLGWSPGPHLRDDLKSLWEHAEAAAE